MPGSPPRLADPSADACHCLAVRQAGRAVTQLYDQHLAEVGLRSTQFSILARLHRLGPITINALAAELVTDRTTLGRNILPLERDGLVDKVLMDGDRRARALQLTEAGQQRLDAGIRQWALAQAAFEARMGAVQAAELRGLLQGVSGTLAGAVLVVEAEEE